MKVHAVILCADFKKKSLNFLHNVKHKKLSPFSDSNSESMFTTSYSLPMIMSHMLYISKQTFKKLA